MDALKNYSLLVDMFNKNTRDVQSKIISTMAKEPSETDGEGWLYGFNLKSDKARKKKFWMKLGRTKEEDPHVRVKKWRGNMIFAMKTIYNKRLERLTHLFFKFAHMHRPENDRIKEKEWFYFSERINVEKHVAEIRELVDDLYGVESSSDDESSESGSDGEEEGSASRSSSIPVRPLRTDRDQLQEPAKLVNININNASCLELTKLPGIGEALANRIIKYRGNKKFDKIEDVMHVPYIKAGIFSHIKHLICA
jgi:DNA uptake protein ComE-like DNA-binding protein